MIRKVILKEPNREFASLKESETFVYNGHLHMKIVPIEVGNLIYNAICFEDGRPMIFAKVTKVEPVDLEIKVL